MRTLVLNAGFEPMQLICWKRALCLVLSSKAEIVAEYGEHTVRSVSQTFTLPSVVRLTRYVRYVKRFGFVKCTRKNILLRDRHTCQYCGVRCQVNNATLDHILPVSRGGKTSWTNVVTCCATCNRKKANRTPSEAGMQLRSKPKRPQWKELVSERSEHMVESTWLPFLETGSWAF